MRCKWRLTTRGMLGYAEKNINGNVRRIASVTEIMDKIMKECDFGLLAVVTVAGKLAFKEAYRGSVVDDVNAKAMVPMKTVEIQDEFRLECSLLMPCHRAPGGDQLFSVPLACAMDTKVSQRI